MSLPQLKGRPLGLALPLPLSPLSMPLLMPPPLLKSLPASSH